MWADVMARSYRAPMLETVAQHACSGRVEMTLAATRSV
jgi:hypothetical protein